MKEVKLNITITVPDDVHPRLVRGEVKAAVDDVLTSYLRAWSLKSVQLDAGTSGNGVQIGAGNVQYNRFD